MATFLASRKEDATKSDNNKKRSKKWKKSYKVATKRREKMH